MVCACGRKTTEKAGLMARGKRFLNSMDQDAAGWSSSCLLESVSKNPLFRRRSSMFSIGSASDEVQGAKRARFYDQRYPRKALSLDSAERAWNVSKYVA